jgi:hypothetical protein
MASVIDAATQEERFSMLPGKRLASNVNAGGSWNEKLGTVAGLSGRSGDLAAPRDALIRRQLDIALDVAHQKVESFLRVRLN